MEGGDLGLCRVTGPPLGLCRGTVRDGSCTRMSDTCVTCHTCAGYATMTRRGGGGHRLCRDTCRDMGKLQGKVNGKGPLLRQARAQVSNKRGLEPFRDGMKSLDEHTTTTEVVI